MKDDFINYFQSIQNTLIQTSGKVTEYTFRTEIQTLLRDLYPEYENNKIDIIQETSKEKNEQGRPDFKVLKNGIRLGYIETKPIQDDLDQYEESQQINGYLEFSPNLILTNYRDFILYKKGKKVNQETLFKASSSSIDAENVNQVNELLKDFFSSQIEPITDPEELSTELSQRTRRLRELIEYYWKTSNDTKLNKFFKRLKSLHKLFMEILIEDLSEDEFIDTYCQTVTYGLFLSRLTSDETIDKKTSNKDIPPYLGVIQEIFELLKIGDIPEDISWIIDEMVDVLNSTDIEKFKQKQLSFSDDVYKQDPYIYFYEHFLGKYDREKKKSRGVFYTPIPIVKFIVNAIDQLLYSEFGKSGLEDKDVTSLDFATGTGTFLLESFRTILNRCDPSLVLDIIKERILPNFYGFENQISPYVISHLKLSQYLQDKGFSFGYGDRIGVYLTDTLDNKTPKHGDTEDLFPHLIEEGEKSNHIKTEEPIFIVMGNPPYNGNSRNTKPFAKLLILEYKKGIKERKNSTDNDYMKFIRYGQWKIEENKKGILGVITGNSYLYGTTLWKMRKSLLDTFDKLYILNLHGDKDKNEPCENVFDIKVGVCISIFVKLDTPLEEKEVYYFSTLDNEILSRKDKYEFLMKNNLNAISWKMIKPNKSNFWFIDFDLKNRPTYNLGWKINDIFKEKLSGIETQKDKVTIHFDKTTLRNTLKDLIDLPEKDFKEKYGIESSADWNIVKVRNHLVNSDINNILINTKFNNVGGFNSSKLTSQDWNKIEKERFQEILYRPFDIRTTYLTREKGFISRPRYGLIKHFILGNNVGISFLRSFNVNDEWNGILVSSLPTDKHLLPGQRITSVLSPLYLYKNSNGYTLSKTPNFTKEFIDFIQTRYSMKPSPEQILGYIYGVLHSRSYREKYQVFLKTDYPRIPFIDEPDFINLSTLGMELVDHHILKIIYPNSVLKHLHGQNRVVENPHYDSSNQRLYINKDTYFDEIKEEVYLFRVGRGIVLNDYLKSREGRSLSLDEIQHLKKVIRSLEETLTIMDKIDQIPLP